MSGDATYTAQYSATVNSYTVTWVDDNDNPIESQTYEYGAVPSHDAPAKAETEDYTYAFAGWEPEVQAVTGNQTYNATFIATAKEKAPEEKYYEITWVNYDDSEILKETLKEGSIPSHDPVGRAEDDDYTYTFAGWEPEIQAVSGDRIYKAVFTATAKEKAPEEKYYEITWVNYDDSEILKETLKEGSIPFHDPVGRTEDDEYTYTFAGWEPEIQAVSGDRTYKATFTATAKIPETVYYTITWLNDDGSLIETTTAEEGTVPAHANPEKADGAGVSYAFNGWDPILSPATGDATYKATFNEIIQTCRIAWMNDDNTEIDTTVVEYGAMPEHADPVKTTGNGHIYTFKGWTPAVTAATKDAVYTAVFDDTYTESAEQFTKGEYINQYGIANAKVNFRTGKRRLSEE